MKIRSLHPDFFSDARLARLPFEARLLFAGLWCHSDDYGRGRWLPKRIEGDVFPHDLVDIEGLLDLLVDSGRVRRYELDNEEFYEIPTWERYQSPKYRAKSSVPEPPPGHPGPFGDKLEPNKRQSVPDTGNPAPSKPQIEGWGEGEGEGEGVGEGVGEPRNAALATRKPRTPAQQTHDQLIDALIDVMDWTKDQITEPGWGALHTAAAHLRKVGADPPEIARRAAIYLINQPGKLTPNALAKHWADCDQPRTRPTRRQAERIARSAAMAGWLDQWAATP